MTKGMLALLSLPATALLYAEPSGDEIGDAARRGWRRI
jgi:hypothetical protein